MSFAFLTYLIFGRTTSFSAEFNLADLLLINGGDGSLGVVFNGIAARDRAGTSISGGTDLNNDGLADLFIGAPSARFQSGQTYVVFGRTTGFPAEFNLADLLPINGGDGTHGRVFNGRTNNTKSGSSVAGSPDVNGDGLADLLIGAPGDNQAFVVFGRTTNYSHRNQFEYSRSNQ